MYAPAGTPGVYGAADMPAPTPGGGQYGGPAAGSGQDYSHWVDVEVQLPGGDHAVVRSVEGGTATVAVGQAAEEGRFAYPPDAPSRSVPCSDMQLVCPDRKEAIRIVRGERLLLLVARHSWSARLGFVHALGLACGEQHCTVQPAAAMPCLLRAHAGLGCLLALLRLCHTPASPPCMHSHFAGLQATWLASTATWWAQTAAMESSSWEQTSRSCLWRTLGGWPCRQRAAAAARRRPRRHRLISAAFPCCALLDIC